MGKFDSLYAKLNNEQKEAVDSIQGPVMVIAGPGTGKTQILALRIANILRKKFAPPEKILALTFSESGVSAMRRRLIDVAGVEGYYVPVFTFHGFCQSIISAYPEEFSATSPDGNISEVEQIQIGEKILQDGPFTLVRPFGDPTYYLRPMLEQIRNAKKEGIGPEEFLKKILAQEEALYARTDLYHEKGAHKGKMKATYRDEEQAIEKNKELAVFYASYQEQLQKERRYDYEDMILLVVQKLAQDEVFQSKVGAKYEYVLVDEHQDTNSAQNKVAEFLLAEKEVPNVFVVGDEKQAIFRFQGASIENFLYFTNRYPAAKVISLQENYRSGQQLLDSSHALISLRKKNIRTVFPQVSEALHAAKKGAVSAIPAVWEFKTFDAEHYFIAKTIEKLIAEGTQLQEIAILFRENKEAQEIMEMLAKRNIPHVFEGSANMFDDLWVQKILRVFRYCADVGNEASLFEVLSINAFNVPALDRWKLMALRAELMREHKGFLVHIADIMRKPEAYKSVQWERPDALFKTYALLSRLAVTAHEQTLPELLEETLCGIGIVSFMKERGDDPAILSGVRRFSDEMKKFIHTQQRMKSPATIKDFLAYLDLFQMHGIRLDASIARTNMRAVRLMTAHKAKGLEFDYVFIPHVIHGKWGGKRQRNLFHLPSFASFDTTGEEANDDERRLFFVALTRARKDISMSYATTNALGTEAVPSMFIAELLEGGNASHAEKFDGTSYDEEAYNNVDFFLAPRGKQSLPLVEQKEFIKDIFMRRGLSVTALNNYLECPWKYFYVNLLRMPSAETISQLYGTAVHSALQQFFEKAKSGTVPAESELAEMFAQSLEKQILTDSQRGQLLQRGTTMLDSYYDFYKSSWNFNTRNELAFSFPFTETIRLTGKIDKLEIQEDGSVVVVDYKTGKAKTRGQIEKEESGNLKRQLAFYAFFLTHYPQEKYHVRSVELDFVQPDIRGKFHKETFIITSEECSALEQDIRRVADEITSLSFWDKQCEGRKCEWCAVRFE